MDAVKAFNAELSSLYDVKPPISKAKMNSLTRGAIKAIKFYKHVVQSVEKFIQKCKPEYKVPGLYVIDSIVRQSRHQFGVEKDVFAPRFAKNMQTTFLNLLKCPPEDKSKVIRVLNLWQKNAVFQPEVIQPLFDLADPNHPIHKEQTANSNGTLNTTSASNLSSSNAVTKTPPSSGVKGTPKDQKIFSSSKSSIDPAWLAQTKMETANIANASKLMGPSAGTNPADVSLLAQLQHLQQLLLKKQEAAMNENQASVKFDKKLLDFDYGEEEDDDLIMGSSPAAMQSSLGQHNSGAPGGGLEGLGTLLTNPEVLKQLQTLQQTMQGGNTATTQHEMEEKMRKLQQMKQQEDEFDKHLAQTVPSLPFASECELKPSDILKPSQQTGIYNPSGNLGMNTGIMHQDMSQPPPGYPPALPYASQPPQAGLQSVKSPLMDERQDSLDFQGSAPARRDSSSVEIVNCENLRSQSGSPDRYRRRSRSRSPRHRDRDRNRERDKDRDRKSRSRSRSRRRRSRSRDRDRERKRDESRDKMSEEEREKQRERRKRGLPPIVRDKLSVCSTTLWVGHLSKLVHQEELSDTFGEFGDIVSIDLISPRGCAFICMNRRQDAYRALAKLKSHKMQGKAITLAWAPGKGVKGKEWKDYWEVELGVSYIPWNKLNNVTDQDLELLEEGGMIDEDTLPPRLRGKLKHTVSNSETLHHQLHLQQQALAAGSIGGTPIPTLTDGIVNVMSSTDNGQQQQQQQQQMVDTSQPPPIRPQTTAALLAPPNAQLQMMPPGFPITGVTRMIGPMGLQMAHGLMPNVPIGVPPPNMQGLIGPGMMQTMLTPPVNSPFGAGVGVGLLAQIPLPAPAAPSDKPSATGMPHNVPPMGVPPPTSEGNLANLPMLRQPFGLGPPPSMQMQMSQHHHHSDDMDVEMEMEDDIQPSVMNVSKEKQPNLSDQLLAAMGKGLGENRVQDEDGRSSDRNRDRDRDRERERRDRERNDRDESDSRRDRGRGRDRGRDRRRDRDREERRDRGDRELRDNNIRSDSGINSAQDIDSASKKEPKPSLADRLRQLADGTLPLDDRIDGRNNRDRVYEESRRPSDLPPSLMDLPKFPGVPERPDFGLRAPDFRGGPQDPRDFPGRVGGDRDRQSFGARGPIGPPRGPMDDFSDLRMHVGRFPDEFDARIGPNGLRPEDFNPRMVGPPRDDFERSIDMRGRHPMDEYERERYEYEIRQREAGFEHRINEPFDPRGMQDHPDFDPRRRDFFPGPMDQGFGPPPMMGGPRGPRGMGPEPFGPRGPGVGPRGHGPPMFHPRGMGPRGMRPGMRPPFGPRGPPFDPREGDPFFRPAFDDPRLLPGPPLRPGYGGHGPTSGGPDGSWRSMENGPPGSSSSNSWPGGEREPENGLGGDQMAIDDREQLENHRDEESADSNGRGKQESRNNNRSRKSRWGNVSPPPADHTFNEERSIFIEDDNERIDSSRQDVEKFDAVNTENLEDFDELPEHGGDSNDNNRKNDKENEEERLVNDSNDIENENIFEDDNRGDRFSTEATENIHIEKNMEEEENIFEENKPDDDSSFNNLGEDPQTDFREQEEKEQEINYSERRIIDEEESLNNGAYEPESECYDRENSSSEIIEKRIEREEPEIEENFDESEPLEKERVEEEEQTASNNGGDFGETTTKESENEKEGEEL